VNLREAFETVPKRRGGKKCATCVAVAGMSLDDAATLVELLDSEASTAVIALACQKAGYESLTDGTLKRHRRGDCLGLT
jgi:hypothetical protein